MVRGVCDWSFTPVTVRLYFCPGVKPVVTRTASRQSPPRDAVATSFGPEPSNFMLLTVTGGLNVYFVKSPPVVESTRPVNTTFTRLGLGGVPERVGVPKPVTEAIVGGFVLGVTVTCTLIVWTPCMGLLTTR